MLNKETKERLVDYFNAHELVAYLEGSELVTVQDVIEAFEIEIEEILDDIEELMGVSHD